MPAAVAPPSTGPCSIIGYSTFSAAVSTATRLNDWKTKPKRSRRRSARAFSSIAPTGRPSRSSVPASGRSRRPSRLISVVFPEPDGPCRTRNSPARDRHVHARERRHGRRSEPVRSRQPAVPRGSSPSLEGFAQRFQRLGARQQVLMIALGTRRPWRSRSCPPGRGPSSPRAATASGPSRRPARRGAASGGIARPPGHRIEPSDRASFLTAAPSAARSGSASPPRKALRGSGSYPAGSRAPCSRSIRASSRARCWRRAAYGIRESLLGSRIDQPSRSQSRGSSRSNGSGFP